MTRSCRLVAFGQFRQSAVTAYELCASPEETPIGPMSEQLELACMPPTVTPSASAILTRESEEFRRVVAEWGPLILPSQAARLVGLSNQRVFQLIELGQIEVWMFFGHQYVSLPQLQARQRMPRKVGRPKKVA